MTEANVSATPIVYTVDDDPAMLESLVFMFGVAGIPVRAFRSPTDFSKKDVEDAPGCLVLDLSMPEMTGIELYRKLLAEGFELPVVILTGHATVETAVDAMRIGAADYLQKPVGHDELLSVVRRLLLKDQERLDAKKEQLAISRQLQTLTSRELEVMALVTEGMLTKQIASKLNISIKTVEVHRSNLSRKLGVTSVAQLAKMMAKLPRKSEG